MYRSTHLKPSFLRLIRRDASTKAAPPPTPIYPYASPQAVVNPGNWPWIQSKNPATGTLISERVVYSRPLNFRPKLIWLMIVAVVPGCFVAADTVLLKAEIDAELASTAVTNSEPIPAGLTAREQAKSLLPFCTNETLLASVLLSCGGVFGVMGLYYPTRVIRRLTQVREGLGGGQVRDYIRVDTAAQEMWRGKWGRAREIDPTRIRVGLIRGGTANSPFLRFLITTPPGTGFSLDKQSYRLDFRKVDEKDYISPDGKNRREDNEVVISWKRLEQVFGRIE